MKNSIIVLMFVSVVCFGFSVQSAETSKQTTPKIYKILDRPLIPTGLGVTKLSGKDYYMGQFSIDSSAIYRSVEDLLYIDAARRMEFKFVSERRVSGRTFGRQLAESMKINNEKESLKAHMGSIKRFMGFFKKSIKKGDVIKIDYHKDFGTRVYYNDRRLGEISSGEIADKKEFYRIILNIWLGERPPSSTFKSGLLGQNGDDYAIRLQNRFKSM